LLNEEKTSKHKYFFLQKLFQVEIRRNCQALAKSSLIRDQTNQGIHLRDPGIPLLKILPKPPENKEATLLTLLPIHLLFKNHSFQISNTNLTFLPNQSSVQSCLIRE
jgi:hypothetical protein